MPTMLLDPRVWGLLIFVVLESIAGWRVYHKGLDTGRAEVQAQFSAYKEVAREEAIAALQKNAAETKAMNETNQKVTANYESLKTATATAIGALDVNRLRLQAALTARNRTTPGNPVSSAPADAAPEDRILGECLAKYEEVAGDANGLSDQVKALQDYVTTVVPK